LIALGAGFAWRYQTSVPRDELALGATRAVVLTPAMQTLPDGSVVELKFGAQIAADFSGEFRRVSLIQGEAHFEVAKDAKRPFIVSAGGVEFRAVGTAFSVQLGKEQVEMLVTEGRVAVSKVPEPTTLADPGPPSDPVVVEAGKRVVMELGAATPQVAEISTAELAEKLSWRAPRLEFTDTPLAEAVALMNQHAAGRGLPRLVLEDEASAQLPVSGMFRADNTAAFVRILEVNFGLKAIPEGNTIALKKAP
jgi:transmembrane sensor